MKSEYLQGYRNIKEQFKQEVELHPNKEHELTLIYSPLINYQAVKYTDIVLHDIEMIEVRKKLAERSAANE